MSHALLTIIMDENTDYNRLLIDYMCPIISDDRLWFLVRLPITSLYMYLKQETVCDQS